MKYANSEMRVDQIISYFNQGKINLIPPFQRGTVWSLPMRRALLANIIKRRPIPALFLYKEATGAQYTYNILDGKQRLESLILYVGNTRNDLRIDNIDHYFVQHPARKTANFPAPMENLGLVSFKDLPDEQVRQFREYKIPTIEIDLDDEGTSIDEVVSLFVDINQKGVKVSPFDVVKALRGRHGLVRQVFDLVAIAEQRNATEYYKRKSGGPFVPVLSRLKSIEATKENNSKVNRMWERLTEVALYCATRSHRRPGEVLHALISTRSPATKLNKETLKTLRDIFESLRLAYQRHSGLAKSSLARDQPQFYTMITSLILLTTGQARPSRNEAARRLESIGAFLGNSPGHSKLLSPKKLAEWRDLSTKATADPGRRKQREQLFLEMFAAA